MMRYICYGAFSTAASIVGVIVLFTGGPAIAFEKVRAEVKKVDAVTDHQFSLDPPKGFTEGIFGFVKPVVPAKK